MATGLRFGPIGEQSAHVCVDMQGLFRGGSPWAMAWFDRVMPNVRALVSHAPARTFFTRFIPPNEPLEAGGAWSRYYSKWPEMTLDRLDRKLVDVVPELAAYAPPAKMIDKYVYSPWFSGELVASLKTSRINTLIISGGETDVCVLATVMGAIDIGYRVVIVTDAVCSSSDPAHDAMQLFYGQRLSQQVETAETEEILGGWRV
ncbi:cysteine hydrolase [Phyllobacterium sp. 21LDTY02-6]|uniref:cysteine hydrolase family protein n=1 Tax=Phyllobacterium sp. 21LDTY02-6 TaxID=2944903 RepID=UPI0020214B56|nr:cysteine hydrolase [Phyllobacterium sp. 21LDTY02-6]MCO4319611.1 cysteine hydrolase [Phyllobacterium sp. 21LDTY02-6]